MKLFAERYLRRAAAVLSAAWEGQGRLPAQGRHFNGLGVVAGPGSLRLEGVV